jgi:exonuclease SbcC
VHGLQVTAFGPFGATIAIDVDALSTGGLFLLTGPTGAGKTSVLDAICFGLFGRVPGDRQQADRLRSDHAPPGVAPEVRLDVTLGERRLRLTRSPRWQRPSTRARSGWAVQQASVLLQEADGGGGWRTLSTRIDEAQLSSTTCSA